MTAPSSLVANLACSLYLLRDNPAAGDDALSALRILQYCLDGNPLSLGAGSDGMVVNGIRVPTVAPGATDLRDQLLLHGVGEMDIPPELADGELLDLLRALAAPRGTYPSLAALSDRVSESIRSAIVFRAPGTHGDEEPPLLVEAGGFHMGSGMEGRRSSAELVIDSVRAADRQHEVEQLLEQLEAQADDAKVPDLLNEVVAQADAAMQRQDWHLVVRIAETVMRCEAAVPSDALGRAYPITLRRMLPRSVLEAIARMLTTTTERAGMLAVLRRMGADSTEVLLGLLAAAPTMEERRVYYDALRQMTEGAESFARMLTRDEWYVVRNVAELCGDLRLETAVPQLTRQMQHPDERVRRAVAGALTKIGTPATVEPLRQALRDGAPAVRLQTLQGLDGWKSRGLTMSLTVRLDEEPEPALVRETLLALGRIGTPEAVQALARASAPGKRLFNRKPSALRLNAIEALALAGDAAVGALQGLLTDDDAEVRSAAGKALAHIAD